MSSVVVLNASYEPLGHTKVARALALVFDGRAVIQEHDESRVLRTVGGIEFPLPVVIRLLTYLKVPFEYREERWSKEGVLRRDKFCCAYCGTSKGKMTVDHIIPRNTFSDKSEANTWKNTVTACSPCNNKKAHMSLAEAGMSLLYEPTIPMKLYIKKESRKSR